MESVNSLRFGDGSYQQFGGQIFAKKIAALIQDMPVIRLANKFTEGIALEVRSIRNCSFGSSAPQTPQPSPYHNFSATADFASAPAPQSRPADPRIGPHNFSNQTLPGLPGPAEESRTPSSLR